LATGAVNDVTSLCDWNSVPASVTAALLTGIFEIFNQFAAAVFKRIVLRLHNFANTHTHTPYDFPYHIIMYYYYRGADKSLARPTSRCISFDGKKISFDAPIMIINRIYETQNLLSLWLVSFLVGLRTYQHPYIVPLYFKQFNCPNKTTTTTVPGFVMLSCIQALYDIVPYHSSLIHHLYYLLVPPEYFKQFNQWQQPLF
jgi:hypothetical protein